MTDYYVKNAGDDAKSGLDDTNAWKTISKVNSSSFSGDDNIYFNKGDEWREQLTAPSSGTSGHLITFGAYGSGATPIINGADVMSTWTSYSGNTWQKTGVTTEPYVVWIDGTKLTKGSDKDSLNDHEWIWDTNVLYLRDDTGDPDVTGVSIEASQRTYCIEIGANINYTKYDGLDIKHSNERGIIATTGGSGVGHEFHNLTIHETGRTGIFIQQNNCLVKDSTISYTGRSGTTGWGEGIYFHTSDVDSGEIDNCIISYCLAISGKGICGSSGADGVHIHNCVVHHTDGSGMKLYEGSDNWIFENNEVYNCGNGTGESAGINLRAGSHANQPSNNIIRYNKIHDNVWAGICLFYADSNQVYYNILYGNNTNSDTDMGQLNIKDADNNEIYNNTIYNGGTYGIRLEGSGANDCSSNLIKNNISQGNTSQDLYVLGTHTGLVLDYNCYYRTSGNIIYYDDTNYTVATFSTYQTAKSQDANSITQDPLFINPTQGNFHLHPNSPCIDAGADVGLTEDYDGNPVPG